MPAGTEDGSGSAAEAGEYEGMPEAAPDADMMKSESLSTAAAAAIAARAAAAARLREEEHKRTLLEEEAVCASLHPLFPLPFQAAPSVTLLVVRGCLHQNPPRQALLTFRSVWEFMVDKHIIISANAAWLIYVMHRLHLTHVLTVQHG